MSDIVLPFLKWAGGKRWLAGNSEFKIPEISGRYIEPFLGSGSIFFSMQPKDAILSDVNSELIDTYLALRDEHEKVSRHLKLHAQSHSKSHYYYVRDEMKPRSTAGRAARFLYLNRTCWNGLYRVNLKGKFNVPKGTKSNVILETDDFESVSQTLRKAKLLCCDFEAVVNQAQSSDFI